MTSRTRAGRTDPVRVLLPDEPPTLTPAAARALLQVLLKAHARLAQEGTQMTDHETLTAPEEKETR